MTVGEVGFRLRYNTGVLSFLYYMYTYMLYMTIALCVNKKGSTVSENFFKHCTIGPMGIRHGRSHGIRHGRPIELISPVGSGTVGQAVLSRAAKRGLSTMGDLGLDIR